MAKVAKVERTAGYTFARIVCDPAGGVDQYRQVLVLSRAGEEAPPPPPAEEPGKQRGKAKRPKRGE